MALPELREATAADIPAMLEVFFHAVEELDQQRGQALHRRNAAPLEMHFGHLLLTDPHSCYIADDRGGVIAFGIVMRRDAEIFLSFLFVEPAWQGRGIGHAVLDACITGAGDGLERLSTCAEANQPVSTGLYAKIGMAPRCPLYLVRGELPVDALPVLSDGIHRRPITSDAVASFDREVVGYDRPGDHVFWARERTGALYFDDAGTVLGYGYAHRSGRIGPVAAVDPKFLPYFIGDLVRTVDVLEGRQLVVPGPAITALQPLLQAGLRIDGSAAVYCSDGPGPRFDRYIPMSYALL